MMLNSLDWLVILFMGLAGVAILSLALMLLCKNKVVRYVTTGIVLAAAGVAAFFGFMVGITGYFIGQLAVALMAGLLIAGAVALGVLGTKNTKLFLYSRIASVMALVLGMASAFFI